ncbi:PH domain-containing protein [Pseudonocardia nematodicida]|uniref:PH domain-containing protein n=1 Tax=Pseudonocardia nematodicida TaxID=1206997 RepID=A0ABV1KI12_9PSEU
MSRPGDQDAAAHEPGADGRWESTVDDPGGVDADAGRSGHRPGPAHRPPYPTPGAPVVHGLPQPRPTGAAAVQHSPTPHSPAPHSAGQHSAGQHSAGQHSAGQHSPVPQQHHATGPGPAPRGAARHGRAASGPATDPTPAGPPPHSYPGAIGAPAAPWLRATQPGGVPEQDHAGTSPDGPADGHAPPHATGPDAAVDDASAWRRLPALMLIVGPATALLKLAPALIALLIFGAGGGNSTQVWIAAAIAVMAVVAGVVRWRTTRYRITPERVELHTGLLNRQRRSVPRDRIRTVDLTAPLLHRLVGVSVVKVGSGQSAGSESGLDLDAVTTAEAERLRRELLARPAVPEDSGSPEPGPAAPGEELDRLDWSSLRYAPLTVSSLAAIGALAGAGWNLLNEASVDPRTLPGADAVAGELSRAPLWWSVLVGASLLLTVMIAGSVVLFVERWWDFRLTREPDGTLRVRRGLLTKRSLSVSEQRLRGVTVTEPLLVRGIGRGAQAGALTVGLAGSEGGGGSLGPPVRRRHAHTVAATAARAGYPITAGTLVAHPPAARTRRLVRAVVPVLVLPVAAGVLAWTGGPVWPLAIALVLLAAAVPLGLDRYRALGHRLDERYLVARSGSLVRTTAALRRDGVIGWRIRQSLFQRRAGVVTLEATTAAGDGSVQVLDLSPDDAAALMSEITPEAVSGFRS